MTMQYMYMYMYIVVYVYRTLQLAQLYVHVHVRVCMRFTSKHNVSMLYWVGVLYTANDLSLYRASSLSKNSVSDLFTRLDTDLLISSGLYRTQ